MYEIQVKNARAVEDSAVGMSSHFRQMQLRAHSLQHQPALIAHF